MPHGKPWATELSRLLTGGVNCRAAARQAAVCVNRRNLRIKKLSSRLRGFACGPKSPRQAVGHGTFAPSYRRRELLRSGKTGRQNLR